ncbi:MAG: GNAT family N-acetyltransferase [Xenococcaceae cyanobacterium MO_188.B29]|nr:GNAT family N-acetyltransferase [Xenococcaceae cyanobacterium MO_188.B29]
MPSIRLMTLNDLPQVAELDGLAFNTTRRTDRHLQACLDLNPTGCFVATAPNNHLVGYVFTRMWGMLGWLGVLGVHPDQQGGGFGKALVNTAIKSLRSSGCQRIGLSTAAENPNNVGLYVCRGFLPCFPTLEVFKTTEQPKEYIPFTFSNQIDRDRALKIVSQISQQARAGLDYASEVRNALNYQWGETLFFGESQPWAFALVRTEPKREESVQKVLEISVITMPHETRKQLPKLFGAIEEIAYKRNFSQIHLAVNTSDGESLQQTLRYGFRVKAVRIRMTLEKILEPATGVDLSRWAM